MRGADLHVFVLGIIDFALNSALQGSVVARAGRQMQDDEEPRSHEQSKEENSHSVFRIEVFGWPVVDRRLAGTSSQTRDNGHINVSAQRESGASANQNLANSRPNRAASNSLICSVTRPAPGASFVLQRAFIQPQPMGCAAGSATPRLASPAIASTAFS
jgi:hypothetical protein